MKKARGGKEKGTRRERKGEGRKRGERKRGPEGEEKERGGKEKAGEGDEKDGRKIEGRHEITNGTPIELSKNQDAKS